jgi:hypothetical protein
MKESLAWTKLPEGLQTAGDPVDGNPFSKKTRSTTRGARLPVQPRRNCAF